MELVECKTCSTGCCSKYEISLECDEAHRLLTMFPDLASHLTRDVTELSSFIMGPPCPLLTADGCRLSHDDRPMVCRNYPSQTQVDANGLLLVRGCSDCPVWTNASPQLRRYLLAEALEDAQGFAGWDRPLVGILDMNQETNSC